MTLMTVAGGEDLWTLRGPTNEALRRMEPGGLATDERIVLAAALRLWNEGGRVSVADLHRLCPRCFDALSRLVELDSPEAVDGWIGQFTQRSARCLQRAGSVELEGKTRRIASWRSGTI